MKIRLIKSLIMISAAFMLICLNGCGQEAGVSDESKGSSVSADQKATPTSTTKKTPTPTSSGKKTPTPTTSAKKTPTPTSATKKITTPTVTPTPSFMDDCLTLGSEGKLQYNGEEWYAVWGENKALLYRYVEGNFEEAGHFALEVIKDYTDKTVHYTDKIHDTGINGKYCEGGKFYVVNRDLCEAFHCGEDVFCLYNDVAAQACYVMSESGKGENETSLIYSWTSTESHWDKCYWGLITPFKNGYAFFKGLYSKTWGSIDEDFVVLFTNKGELVNQYYKMGYRNGITTPDKFGIFYCDSCFYNLYKTCILDLNKLDLGRPMADYAEYFVFENDVCPMITYKNGKMWAFYIDIKGNVLSNVAEFKSGVFQELEMKKQPVSYETAVRESLRN